MKKILYTVLFVSLIISSPVFSAPLFPDVPENHWARDSVADLSSKGIFEGYPDGTFKGDRSITRWEMALCIARTLAKMEATHSTFATKSEMETLRALANNLKDELSALGVRVGNLEENVSNLDKRVTELERISFEGEFVSRWVTTGIKNTGRKDTNWQQDVGSANGLNFNRLHKMGTIDMLNGRPLVNGSGFTSRMRLGVKIKVSREISAGIRFAGYTSAGERLIDAYWGVSAPYLSNPFAANRDFGIQGKNGSPWAKLSLDSFIMNHSPSGTSLTVGSISETDMDSFVLAKTPNPNASGKSMAKFSEKIVGDRKDQQVVTLKYYEDEETYLPFYGVQVKGKSHLISDVAWETMYSKLPFGVNPTAGTGQPATSNAGTPYFLSALGKWKIGDQGIARLNILYAKQGSNTDQNNPSNLGNYWFWTDPQSYADENTTKRPMRGNAFISSQSQLSWGVSVNYLLKPSYIRTVIAYSGSRYKPNQNSGYTAKGNHFKIGAGWTNPRNNLSLDLEYISTDPYYDAFQLYFQPVGSLRLGGVPPGTPIAFAVVPMYFGGFPGSYAPFAYQLHDSGAYPNNRNGFRFSGEYLFPDMKGQIDLRYAYLWQNQISAPQRTTNGDYRGMKPGFIDPIFHPLETDGDKIMEKPRGKQFQIGLGVNYEIMKKLKTSLQYDHFRFLRDTGYQSDMKTAKRNLVDIQYNVLKIGLEYPLNKKFTLNGGLDYASVRGYHPTLNSNKLPGMNADAGDTILNVRQYCPYLGFQYDIKENMDCLFNARIIKNVDKIGSNEDDYSPESFSGLQLTSQFRIKF